MKFIENLSKSFGELKQNFSKIFGILFLYMILPIFIVFALGTFLFFSIGLYSDLPRIVSLYEQIVVLNPQSDSLDPALEGQITELVIPFLIKLLIVFGILLIPMIISLFLSVKGYLILVCASLRKQGYDLKEAKKKAKDSYWKFVGLLFVYLLFMFGLSFLSVLLSIPVSKLIFAILSIFISTLVSYEIVLQFVFPIIMVLATILLFSRLIFSLFLLVEGSGIFSSISKSWKMSGPKWSMVIVQMFLIYLIYWAISFLVSTVTKLVFDWSIGSGNISVLSVLIFVISIFISWLVGIFYASFQIVFFKNIYQFLKGNK